jgi:hypothetical protein
MNRAMVSPQSAAMTEPTGVEAPGAIDEQMTHLVGSLSADQIGRFVAGLRPDNAILFTRIYKRYQHASFTQPFDANASAIDPEVYELLEALTEKQLEATVGCLCETQLTLFFRVYRRYHRHHDEMVAAARRAE